MKNTINYISKNIVLFGLLFLSAYSGYSQCASIVKGDYVVNDDSIFELTVDEQYERMKLCLLCIKEQLKDKTYLTGTSSYTSIGVNSLSISMVESSSHPGQYIFAAGAKVIIKLSTDQAKMEGFFKIITNNIKHYYSTNVDSLVLLTGKNNEDQPFLVSKEVAATTYSNFMPLKTGSTTERIGLYFANMPSRSKSEIFRNYVHSELILLSYYQIYEPNLYLDPGHIAFTSDLPHCARCYTYLRTNEYHVPTTATHIYNENLSKEFDVLMTWDNSYGYDWTLPNYTFPTVELPTVLGGGVDQSWKNNGTTTSKLGNQSMVFLQLPAHNKVYARGTGVYADEVVEQTVTTAKPKYKPEQNANSVQ